MTLAAQKVGKKTTEIISADKEMKQRQQSEIKASNTIFRVFLFLFLASALDCSAFIISMSIAWVCIIIIFIIYTVRIYKQN